MFKHPDRTDLYIALADRWMPGLPQAAGDDFASGEQVRRVLTAMAGQYDPEGWYGEPAAAFSLMESAQARWRMVNAPHLVALVRAGARFEKGKLVERPDESGGDQLVA